MKKIIFSLILLVGFMVSTQSIQAQITMANPNGYDIDTVTNSTAEGPALQVKSYQSTYAMVIPITKISGTITGSIKWQGSTDGSNFFTVSSDTLLNASNVYGYSESPKKWSFYRALISPTGTSSLSYKGISYFTKANSGQ